MPLKALQIGLGKDFNSVEEGLTHKVMRGVMDVAVVVSYYGMVPWMLNLMSKLPKAAPEGYMKFFDHCNNQVQAQREVSCIVSVIVLIADNQQ
jgi:hypothetical protein